MTLRDLFNNALIEINKIEAQSLLIEDYNYYINKAFQQYVNLVYNRYDINQQSTDDLSSFQKSIVIDELLEPTKTGFDQFCEIELPSDYLHLLNCIVEFETTGKINCQLNTQTVSVGCKRLTADIYPQIINNAYMRPTYKNPYYYINNLTSNDSLDKVSKPRLEIHFGIKDKVVPKKVHLTYIKIPEIEPLSYEDLDEVEDPTNDLEYPDYVCYEVINVFCKLLLEQASDPRLQTNYPINQTIMSNTQQVQQQK